MSRPVLPWWTPAQWDAAEERDHERRLNAPRVPSSSVVPARCGTCGHWNAKAAWLCANCGIRLR